MRWAGWLREAGLGGGWEEGGRWAVAGGGPIRQVPVETIKTVDNVRIKQASRASRAAAAAAAFPTAALVDFRRSSRARAGGGRRCMCAGAFRRPSNPPPKK